MNLFSNAIFIQSIGFIGTILIAIGMQQKTYNRIMLCKISNEFIGGIQYLLLGGYTGMILNLTSCITNAVYWHRIKNNKSTLIFQIIFGVMFVILGAYSWHGYVSILAILAKVISTVSLGINNPKIIRIMNLISNPCWLFYNIFVGSIAGICSDSLVLCSVIIGIIRIDIRKSQSV